MTSIKIIVHRGAHEIGGNCVEIATEKSRLIVDVGMPLSEMTEDRSVRRKKPIRADLVERGIILPIPGLFEAGPKIEGILLSHAHGDHFGLVNFTCPNIPVYLSRGASKMLMSGWLFAGQDELTRQRQNILLPGKARRIGDFRVTAYLVDHSSYGSLAFMIEGEGKRIVYSGDLRLRGRKPGMAKTLLSAIRKAPLDVLIMEGTSLSRGDEPGPSEQDVESQLVASLKQTEGLALGMLSPQNVDRLVTYYRAAVRSARTLVLDPYAAFILYMIHHECSVPDPFQDRNTRIFLTEEFRRSFAGRRLRKLEPKMKNADISRDAILAAPERMLMIFRERMYEKIFDGHLPTGSRVFYSYWPGYLERPRLKELRKRLEASGCAFELVHASGHIYAPDIREFISRANPRQLIPIHTTAAEKMLRRFPHSVTLLREGEPFYL